MEYKTEDKKTFQEVYVDYELMEIVRSKGFDDWYGMSGGTAYNNIPQHIVMRWLREEKGININIHVGKDFSTKEKTYMCDILNDDIRIIKNSVDVCDTYEKAVNSAIKYVIEREI